MSLILKIKFLDIISLFFHNVSINLLLMMKKIYLIYKKEIAMNFTYYNPTKILFGAEHIASIKNEIPTSKKVLVLYGGGSIKKNHVYEDVMKALSEHEVFEFSGIEPNPTVETLDKAVNLVRSNQIDFLLAVGGGSVIDGTKYVAAAACYDGHGWDILEKNEPVINALPIGSVLTLPATGSESNSGSVITKKETNQKLAFMSPLVQPKFSVLDPKSMETLPERQLVNGIVDAWVHVCEQYITTPQDAMVQDGYAEALLKNLIQLAKDFPSRSTTPNWNDNLMWTANQALNGLIGAGVSQDWGTHMIGHELTALFGVDHARSLAIIQPSLLRNQISKKREKLNQMGKNVFGLNQSDNLAEETINHIEKLFHSLNVKTHLDDYGMSKADAVKQVIAKLEKHGMVQLGENQAITPDVSEEILDKAIV